MTENPGNDVVRLVVHVGPNGELEAVGGDRMPGPVDADTPYIGLERIKQRFEDIARHGRRNLNCDQVAWILDIFGRYLPPYDLPAVSQLREMTKYAMLYELMEVANLRFEDRLARYNGTPWTARPEE